MSIESLLISIYGNAIVTLKTDTAWQQGGTKQAPWQP